MVISGCGAAGSQNYSGNHSDKRKAYDLDQHRTADVNAREAVPVPVRNVGCYRSEDSSDKDETVPNSTASDLPNAN